ncbi:MAG: Maf family protein [Patescibacteria group bacterium]|jgi:septum formation protein
MDLTLPIILGSSSKSRQEILKRMGYTFEVLSPDIDEQAFENDNPQSLALAIGLAKADALRKQVYKDSLVITSDTVVVWNGLIRGKPTSEEEARAFLHSYAEHPAETVTSVVVTNTKSGKVVSAVDTAKVYFRPLPNSVVDKLIEHGTAMHCSGGLRAEDPILQPYILRIEGTMDSVMGLPMAIVKPLLEEAET